MSAATAQTKINLASKSKKSPKGAKKSPKEAKKSPKGAKKSPKEAKKSPKEAKKSGANRAKKSSNRAKKSGAKKGAKATAVQDKEKKKRHHSRLPRLCFQPASIYKVLAQVHPDYGMSGQAMKSMIGLTGGVAQWIVQQAVDLCHADNKKTLSSREVQTAVRLCFPGELAKHGVSEGVKAVTKFLDSKGNTKGKKQSGAARAGLQFSVGRARRILKAFHSGPIGRGAPVYLAAVIEYIVAEVMELSGNAARDNKRVRVTNRHLELAVHNDEELHRLFKHVTFASGGVIPHIHAVLLPKKSKKAESE